MRIPDIVVGDGYSGKEEMVRERYGPEDEKRSAELTEAWWREVAQLGKRGRRKNTVRTACEIYGCGRDAHAKNLCLRHYGEMRRADAQEDAA